MKNLSFMACCLLAILPVMADELVYVIPLKPDPPFTVDGDLSDWQGVPNQFNLNDKEHVTWSGDQWKGPSDLSAKGWMAWRTGTLFVAVEVTDDVVAQKRCGKDMYLGDHVELYLDFNPNHEPGRASFGDGQWTFGISPGSLTTTGDPQTDIKPEVFCYRPVNHSIKGVQVAAKRTPTGYTLEAAIPFELLKVSAVDQNTEVNGELAISDCDSAEPKQEKMMTLSTRPWESSRLRLGPMVFGDAAGKGTLPPRGLAIRKEMTIKPSSQEQVAFDAPAIPPGKEAYLFLRARMHSAKVAGWGTGALALTLNGQAVDGARFTNRPLVSKTGGGMTTTVVTSTGEANVFFSPDFTAADTDSHYRLLDGSKACEFEFRVTDLLKSARNELALQNRSENDPQIDRTIRVGDLGLVIKNPPPPPKQRRPAPTGSIPNIVPADKFPRRYTIAEKNSTTLEIKVGDDHPSQGDPASEVFIVKSQFSSPDGQWNAGSCEFYEHHRRIEPRDEAILVFDTFKNVAQRDVPIIQRHTCALEKRLVRVWLGGACMESGQGVLEKPGNPSTYGVTSQAGIGLLPLNDAFQVHAVNSCADGTLGLADNSFVLKNGSTYTAEWCLVPTAKPGRGQNHPACHPSGVGKGDFWEFVNAARRVLDVNFTLPYQFAFLRPEPKVWMPDTDENIRSFIENKGIHVLCVSTDADTHASTHFIEKGDHAKYVRYFEIVKRVAPDVRPIIYWDCFLDTHAPNIERFKADRALKSDGTQLDYGGTYSFMKIFLPTPENGFGAEMARFVDTLFDKCGARGIYWDEIEHSACRYHYGKPWDEVSGDIDPQTFTLVNKKSSVTLLSQPFRLQQAKRILARGPLVGNSPPHTRSMARLKFQRFTETGLISNCADMLLYSPVALGDHLTERNEVDSYRVMLAALDYGCVYNWYDDHIMPTHKNLACYMFPITPMELHEGYILGKERIITKVSGLYGWNDASSHEAHVFNEKGEEVADFKTPLVRKDGKTFTELRLAEDWSAAILRRPER
ncbi:MAG: hypothetical protein HY360_04410 [Verrucomicrobia bacterium]|nr:hypothetical protein [Verrucomicrobiota bacterium]